MTGPISAVVFDLDGTLIDSRRDLAAAVNATRAEFGLVALEEAEVIELVGHGARDLVRRALPAPFSGDRFEAAFGAFTGHYLAGCLGATRPYPGVPELLAELAPRLPLAVVTNKPEAPTRKILDGLGLTPYFQVVLGGDSLPVRKPNPQPLEEAARRLGVSVAATLLVGDSAIDAETAQRAGAPFAWVAWGFGTAQEVAPFPQRWRVETPGELVSTGVEERVC